MDTNDPIAIFRRSDLKQVVKEAIQEMLPKPDPDLDKQLSLEDVTKLARKSKGTIRAWVKAGILPAHGPGKIKTFIKSEVISVLTTSRK